MPSTLPSSLLSTGGRVHALRSEISAALGVPFAARWRPGAAPVVWDIRRRPQDRAASRSARDRGSRSPPVALRYARHGDVESARRSRRPSSGLGRNRYRGAAARPNLRPESVPTANWRGHHGRLVRPRRSVSHPRRGRGGRVRRAPPGLRDARARRRARTGRSSSPAQAAARACRRACLRACGSCRPRSIPGRCSSGFAGSSSTTGRPLARRAWPGARSLARVTPPPLRRRTISWPSATGRGSTTSIPGRGPRSDSRIASSASRGCATASPTTRRGRCWSASRAGSVPSSTPSWSVRRDHRSTR